MSQHKRNGFTLIELLVVVSIIALLVSILLPALGKARAQARKIVCATHLNQIGRGMSMYLTEENGRYPRNYNGSWSKYDLEGASPKLPRWWFSIIKYVDPEFTVPNNQSASNAKGTVGQCPDHKPEPKRTEAGYSYRANQFLVPNVSFSTAADIPKISSTPVAVHADKVEQPSEKIFLFEVFTYCEIPLSGTYAAGWGKPIFSNNGQQVDWTQNIDTHGQDSNFLFSDTHVAAHTLTMMRDYDKNWKASN